MRLFTYKRNPRAWKALIVAQYGGLNIEVALCDVGDALSEEMLQRNPWGKLPVLDTPDGSLFESNAIARYLARIAEPSLLGRTDYERGLVDAWIDVSAHEVDVPVAAWLLPLMGAVSPNQSVMLLAKTDVEKVMLTLNVHLERRVYLVGDAITLADIAMAMSLYRPFAAVFDASVRAEFPHVTRWFLHCCELPQFRELIGVPMLCEVALQITP